MKKSEVRESLIYLVLWSLLFTAPVLSLSIRMASDSSLSFDWHEVMIVWRQLGVFLAIFLVHNYLLAPQLVYRKKRALYVISVFALSAFFVVYQCSHRPSDIDIHRGPRPPHEMSEHHPPMPPDFPEQRIPPRPSGGMESDEMRMAKGEKPKEPLLFDRHDAVSIILLLLMLLGNVGIKQYFKHRDDELRFAEIEHRALEERLEYLKYQLSPHFLMNTLNNIHALVDIDGEEAKDAIIQLSKILRYVLYESNNARVTLDRDMEFMENYVRLMRLRYSDLLEFSVTVPSQTSGYTIPPLLFISFVENAFKHGASNSEHCYIRIKSEIVSQENGTNRLLWTCSNSKRKDNSEDEGGVGMANVRQRLNLIFGDSYKLDVTDGAMEYTVCLDIPLELE